MPTILGANTLSTGYEVENSLRFDDGSSAFLSKTFSGDGTSHDIGTVSFWIKRCELSAEQGIFTAGSSNRHFIRFESNNTFTFRAVTDSFHLNTNQIFRETSGWYHFVIAYDTTQGTGSNRVKIYVNGVQLTSFATADYPDQNLDIKLGAAEANHIGNDAEQTTPYYDGYMAEFVYIDGQQLAPTSFGEFDEDTPNIWKPIDVSGLTFGTNGFFLNAPGPSTGQNANGLGGDSSGNGNHFANNNMAAEDRSTDTCTNNFPTLNSLVKAPSSITFSEGNLKAVHPGSWTGVPATIGVQNGKWYWECKVTTGNSANAFTGICIEDVNFNDSTVYNETGLILYFVDGRKTVDGTDTESFFTSLATNDIVGVALDLDSGTKTVTFTKNGSASGSAVNLTSNFDNKFIFPVGIGNSSSATSNWEFNFGSPHYSISSGNSDANGHGNFEYAVPSGHFSINTKNLAEHG